MTYEYDDINTMVDYEEEESTVSYSELVDDELNYNDNSEGEYDTQDDTFHQSIDDSKLKLKAFSYSDNIKEFKSGILTDSELESKLDNSIDAANELLINFGNIDALDTLINLLVEVNNLESSRLEESIVTYLEDFIVMEKCPLIEEDYHQESATQITMELQSHLLNALIDTRNESTHSMNKLIETFTQNPNFASDNRLTE